MKLETTNYFYILRYNKEQKLIDIILEIHYRIKSSYSRMINHSQRYREIIGVLYLDNVDNIDINDLSLGEYLRFEDCDHIKYEANPIKACKLWQEKVNELFKTKSKLEILHTNMTGSYEYDPREGQKYINRKAL